MNVGSYNMKFRLILEVEIGHARPAYIAFDDITLSNCATGGYPDFTMVPSPTAQQVGAPTLVWCPLKLGNRWVSRLYYGT